MKKIIVILMLVALILSIMSCSNSCGSGSINNGSTDITSSTSGTGAESSVATNSFTSKDGQEMKIQTKDEIDESLEGLDTSHPDGGIPIEEP